MKIGTFGFRLFIYYRHGTNQIIEDEFMNSSIVLFHFHSAYTRGSPYRFPRVFGDKFCDEFGDEFGDSLILVNNLVTNLVIH